MWYHPKVLIDIKISFNLLFCETFCRLFHHYFFFEFFILLLLACHIFWLFLYFLKWPQTECNISKHREHKVASHMDEVFTSRGDNRSGSCRVEERSSDNGSCWFNPVMKTGQNHQPISTIHKRVDLFTIRITRLIYVPCRIMLELTRLDLCNSLHENNNLTYLKPSASYKICHIWRKVRRDNQLQPKQQVCHTLSRIYFY